MVLKVLGFAEIFTFSTSALVVSGLAINLIINMT